MKGTTSRTNTRRGEREDAKSSGDNVHSVVALMWLYDRHILRRWRTRIYHSADRSGYLRCGAWEQ